MDSFDVTVEYPTHTTSQEYAKHAVTYNKY